MHVEAAQVEHVFGFRCVPGGARAPRMRRAPDLQPRPRQRGELLRAECSLPLRLSTCVVCDDLEKRWVFMSCGHQKVCLRCLHQAAKDACTSETFMEAGHTSTFHKDCTCPICRTVVREVTLYE